jgi:hypothetical protein
VPVANHQRLLFWSALALLLVLLGWLLAPTLDLGFVADDFFLLVPDQKLRLTQSPDELHRPLRNATIKIVERELGVQHVQPYRVIVASSFAAALLLLFRLTRRLGANRLAALAAVFVLAFFPRNQEVLYWFAAWQDLIAADFALIACIFFVDFRVSSRSINLWIATIAYVIALGFKETIVVLPALLAALDIHREPARLSFFKRKFWTAYIPFAGILLLYFVYFFSQSGAASIAGKKTGGYYGFKGVSGVLAGIVRALVNVALPFSLPLGLKDVHASHIVILLCEAAVVLFLVWRFRLGPAFILAVLWLFCTILPTAAFAAAFNADRYLFIPFVGVAIFAGLLFHAMAASPDASKYGIVASMALLLYTSAGVYQLTIKREVWRNAGNEVAMVLRETMRLCTQLPAGSEVDFINITHSYRPNVAFVLANGLSEALHAHAFPASIRIVRNFSAPEPEQQKLVSELGHCHDRATEVMDNRAILIELDGQLQKLDAACASTLVDSDRAARSLSWNQLYPLSH